MSSQCAPIAGILSGSLVRDPRFGASMGARYRFQTIHGQSPCASMRSKLILSLNVSTTVLQDYSNRTVGPPIALIERLRVRCDAAKTRTQSAQLMVLTRFLT